MSLRNMTVEKRNKSNRTRRQTPKIKEYLKNQMEDLLKETAKSKTTNPKHKPKESKDLQTTEDVSLVDIDLEVPSQLINITIDNNEEEEMEQDYEELMRKNKAIMEENKTITINYQRKEKEYEEQKQENKILERM